MLARLHFECRYLKVYLGLEDPMLRSLPYTPVGSMSQVRTARMSPLELSKKSNDGVPASSVTRPNSHTITSI